MPPGENVVDTDNQQGSLTSIELAWLAGLWDGEGWIGITKAKRSNTKQNRYSASVVFCTTSDRLAMRVEHLLIQLDCPPTTVYKNPRQKKSTWNGKDVWHRERWDITIRSNKGAQVFLEAVAPYMVEKSVCADLVLSYIQWRDKFPYRSGPGKQQQQMIASKAETIMELLRQDRKRNDPPETTRLTAVG